jgi:hypothetical protein
MVPGILGHVIDRMGCGMVKPEAFGYSEREQISEVRRYG